MVESVGTSSLLVLDVQFPCDCCYIVANTTQYVHCMQDVRVYTHSIPRACACAPSDTT